MVGLLANFKANFLLGVRVNSGWLSERDIVRTSVSERSRERERVRDRMRSVMGRKCIFFE